MYRVQLVSCCHQYGQGGEDIIPLVYNDNISILNVVVSLFGEEFWLVGDKSSRTISQLGQIGNSMPKAKSQKQVVVFELLFITSCIVIQEIKRVVIVENDDTHLVELLECNDFEDIDETKVRCTRDGFTISISLPLLLVSR